MNAPLPLSTPIGRTAASDRGARKNGDALQRLFAASLLALSVVASLGAAPAKATEDACGAVEPVIVDHADERGELTLRDGRKVRLAGLDLSVPPSDGTDWRSLLTLLTRDAAIRLSRPSEPDRWGRIAAQLHIRPHEAETEAWLQGFLLETGVVRLRPEPDAKPCWAALKAEEDKARGARAGLWAEPNAVLTPATPEAIFKKRGRLAMVEGKIIGLGESRAVFYLNFGRSWRNDFTVIILKRQSKLFDSAGLKPSDLVDKRVRIRGIVDGQYGPRIEISGPEQIELLD